MGHAGLSLGPLHQGRPTMKLKDKVALITGAGSGIGQATALLFAREGARVAVVDVAAELTQKVAGELSRGGTAARAFVVDVSDSDATAQLAQVAVIERDCVIQSHRVLD